MELRRSARRAKKGARRARTGQRSLEGSARASRVGARRASGKGWSLAESARASVGCCSASGTSSRICCCARRAGLGVRRASGDSASSSRTKQSCPDFDEWGLEMKSTTRATQSPKEEQEKIEDWRWEIELKFVRVWGFWVEKRTRERREWDRWIVRIVMILVTKMTK